MKLFIQTLCFFCFGHNLFAQSVEVRQFKSKNVKVFKSEGLGKSKGLKFLLKYPNSYDAEEHGNQNIVMQFVDNKNFSLIYNIGVVKNEYKISNEEQKIILSKINLQTSIKKISKDAVFIEYKDKLKIDNHNASYVDYLSTISEGIKAYNRQYFIVYKIYLITISFSISNFIEVSLQKTKIKFDNYKSFFEMVVKSLKTT